MREVKQVERNGTQVGSALLMTNQKPDLWVQSDESQELNNPCFRRTSNASMCLGCVIVLDILNEEKFNIGHCLVLGRWMRQAEPFPKEFATVLNFYP